MKNYIIALLAVLLIVSISFTFKANTSQVFGSFPLPGPPQKSSPDHSLQLALFFSEGNCKDCLEIIQTLSKLPPEFQVVGIVPDRELTKEERLRNITGATFPIYRFSDYKKFTPIYWPSLMGIDSKGNVHFVIPSIPLTKQFLEGFLSGYYAKTISLL